MFDLAGPGNDERAITSLRQEIVAAKKFDHKHIIKYYMFKENATFKKTNGKEGRFAYIAQEPALGGELFDYVALAGAFSEKICRFYFKQLL